MFGILSWPANTCLVSKIALFIQSSVQVFTRCWKRAGILQQAGCLAYDCRKGHWCAINANSLTCRSNTDLERRGRLWVSRIRSSIGNQSFPGAMPQSNFGGLSSIVGAEDRVVEQVPFSARKCNDLQWSYLPPHLFAWCQVLRVVHSLPDKVLRGGSSFFPQMWRIVEDLNLWTVDQSLLGSKETPAQWKMSTRNDPKLCFGFGTAILSPRAPLKIRIDLVAYCRQWSTPRLLEDARPGG